MKKISSITLSIILLFVAVVAYSCNSCSNAKKMAATSQGTTTGELETKPQETATEEETTLDASVNATEQETTELVESEASSEEDTSKLEETTSQYASQNNTETKAQETTKKKEETTAKKQETTTKKQETTKKPETKPQETTAEKTTTAAWVPEYYTANDVIGDGLDQYRIGLQKYSSDGTQLYVKTNYTDRHNGYYLVSQYIDPGSGKEDRQLRAKNERFAKAFEEKYNPPTSTGFEWPYNSVGNSAIDGTDYRFHGWNIWPYDGTETVSGEEVSVYVWEDQGILQDYIKIMPLYVTHCKDEQLGLTGNETLEEIINKMNDSYYDENPYSLERYKKGEELARKYGLDFHGTIASYRENS